MGWTFSGIVIECCHSRAAMYTCRSVEDSYGKSWLETGIVKNFLLPRFSVIYSSSIARRPELNLWCSFIVQGKMRGVSGVTAVVTGMWHSEDRASWYILVIKANEMHYISNLFWYRTLHVWDRFTVHHQESSTVLQIPVASCTALAS